jgi:hypothetical protein
MARDPYGIMVAMTTAPAATFLLQFQERHAAPSPLHAGSKTMTRTSEAPDQDPGALAPILAGTRTVTQTIESSDSDPQVFAGTKTLTETSESPDQDAAQRGYFAIPRATCSSS